MNRIQFSLLLIALSCLPKISQADSYSEDTTPTIKEPVSPSVPAVEDPRLPPVIPGQEVQAGGGRRVRMISTTGPVVVSSPTPIENDAALAGSHIVVDSRKGGTE
jgi:hypothetical protein